MGFDKFRVVYPNTIPHRIVPSLPKFPHVAHFVINSFPYFVGSTIKTLTKNVSNDYLFRACIQKTDADTHTLTAL